MAAEAEAIRAAEAKVIFALGELSVRHFLVGMIASNFILLAGVPPTQNLTIIDQYLV